MADNKRWFKVWTSILTDPDMCDCHNDILGAWVRLGALVAQHGTRGKVKISRDHLTRTLHLFNSSESELKSVLERLKKLNLSVVFRNGFYIVTFSKWHKYQVDNSKNRVSKHRQNVTVQEEKRREEKRREKEKNKFRGNTRVKGGVGGEGKNGKSNYGAFVRLTAEQYDRLTSKFGEEKLKNYIAQVNEVFAMKPKVRREYIDGDHNLLIQNWHRRGYFDDAKGERFAV